MKSTGRTRIVLLVVLLASAGLAAAYAAWPRPAPVASFDAMSHDFGEIDPSEPLTHTFTLTNTGRSYLVIPKIRSSCDCLKPVLAKTVLQPGESAELAVGFKFRQGNFVQTARIMVETNDPAAPKIPLELKARASPWFELHPPHVMFGDISSDSAAPPAVEHLVYCRDEAAISVAVEDMLFPSPVAAKFLKQAGGRPRLTVSVDPHAPLGPLTAKIKVVIKKGAEGCHAETRIVPVRGNVVGQVSAVPPELNLGVLSQQGAVAQARIVAVGTEDPRPVTAQVLGSSRRIHGGGPQTTN